MLYMYAKSFTNAKIYSKLISLIEYLFMQKFVPKKYFNALKISINIFPSLLFLRESNAITPKTRFSLYIYTYEDIYIYINVNKIPNVYKSGRYFMSV